MNKNSQKKQKKRHNIIAIKKIAERYGYTERYIRGCITGEFETLNSDQIKKEYRRIKKNIDDLIKTL